MIQELRTYGKKKGLLADCTHWASTCLLIVTLSFCLLMQGCKQSDNELAGTPTVMPRIYPAWVKSFNNQDILNSACQTSDGGFIAAGKAASAQGYHDAWIVKLDAGGNVQWQHGFGERYEDEFFAVLQTKDNGYLATGMTISTGKNAQLASSMGLLVKLTSQGAVQWQKTFPYLVFKSFFQTSDGDFVLGPVNTI